MKKAALSRFYFMNGMQKYAFGRKIPQGEAPFFGACAVRAEKGRASGS